MLADRRLGAVLTVAIAAAALTGCGGGSGAKKPQGTTGASGDSITIKDFKYDPTPLVVKSGAKVTVTNDDSAAHTITADDKSFDSKDLTKGQTFSFTAGKSGQYKYICSIHNYMSGTITVQ